MIEYRINDIPPSLNKFAGRKNVHAYRKLKNEWKRIVWAECRPIPSKPIEKAVVTLEYYFKTRQRHDPDNYSGKMLLDGLTEAGIIVDDDFEHIELRIKQGGISKVPYTIVRIEEIGD